jgi:group I intron endonuclease
MSACIYCFTCKTTGKSYIGQTVQKFENRASAHRTGSANPNSKSYNSKFYRAIRKYGWDSFDSKILATCNRDELNGLEANYIEEYNSFTGGYNETTGGDSPESVSEESNLRRSKTHTERFKNMDEDAKRNWSEVLKKRHKNKPMTEETRKKISESVKKAFAEGKFKNRFKDNPRTIKFPKYIRIRKNKNTVSYIVQNHPKCKFKAFSTMEECINYLQILEFSMVLPDIKIQLEKLQESSLRQEKIFDEIMQAIYNLQALIDK